MRVSKPLICRISTIFWQTWEDGSITRTFFMEQEPVNRRLPWGHLSSIAKPQPVPVPTIQRLLFGGLCQNPCPFYHRAPCVEQESSGQARFSGKKISSSLTAKRRNLKDSAFSCI